MEGCGEKVSDDGAERRERVDWWESGCSGG
jgi:hypothetical protein